MLWDSAENVVGDWVSATVQVEADRLGISVGDERNFLNAFHTYFPVNSWRERLPFGAWGSLEQGVQGKSPFGHLTVPLPASGYRRCCPVAAEFRRQRDEFLDLESGSLHRTGVDLDPEFESHQTGA